MMPSYWEILVILLIILLLFGAKRLPELARAVGESVRIFRESLSDKRKERKK